MICEDIAMQNKCTPIFETENRQGRSGFALILTVLMLISFFGSLSRGADIFVDNQLTDDCIGTYSIAGRDNSGSDGDAYDTPQEAADAAQPGDTVYFREGTYCNESTQRSAVVMNVLTSGTTEHPITFTNYGDEEAILSGLMNVIDDAHYYTLTLGIAPTENQVVSGQGVKNIIIDGLIVEDARVRGLVLFGPANQDGQAANPTENIVIRNVIFRNNGVFGGYGGGMYSEGRLLNVTVEYCEAYDNTGTGIAFGRLTKQFHMPEPDDEMSAAQYSTIRNCLAYNNIKADDPGDTDGISGTNMYRCTFEKNVVYGNSDDGMDVYTSIEVTIKNNLIFNHNYPGGNMAGLKFSAGCGGRHTVIGNTVFNNGGTSFEGSTPGSYYREYYPSKIYNNIAYNGNSGFALGTTTSSSINYNLTYPGFDKVYLRNNIGLDNARHDIYHGSGEWADSDYNFWSNASDLNDQHSGNQDAHSLTGDPQLTNEDIVVDTTFPSTWSIEEKLGHIRTQVEGAFSPATGSVLIDAGIVIDGYHNPSAGANSGDGEAWYGSAPDIGVYEWGPSAHWKMDDDAGSTSVVDTAGSYDGVARSFTSTLSTGGIIDSALTFDGSNDYISVPEVIEWTLDGDFTLALWVRFDSFNTRWWESAFLAQDEGGGPRNKWIFSYNPTSQKTLFHMNGPGIGGHILTGDQWIAQTGAWYFVGLTRSDDTYTFYRQGVADGSQVDSTTLPDVSSALTIGWAEGPGKFDGAIDDVRIYRRALSALEVEAVCDEGPSAHWTMDDNAASKTVVDIIGRGYDGTARESTQNLTVPGMVDNALSFDGITDYISVPDQLDWVLAVDFTISLWVKYDAFNSNWWESAFTAQDQGGGKQNKWIFSYDPTSQKTLFHINGPGSTGPVITGDPWTAETGQWYFIAISRSSDGTYNFYRQGAANGSEVNSETIPDVSASWTIGWGEGGGRFAGIIDDVRVYNRVLSLAEISDLYDQGTTSGLAELLLGHWAMDDNASSTTVLDSSKNGSDGTARRNTSDLSTAGVISTALGFNGTTDYVSVPDQAAWSFPFQRHN